MNDEYLMDVNTSRWHFCLSVTTQFDNRRNCKRWNINRFHIATFVLKYVLLWWIVMSGVLTQKSKFKNKRISRGVETYFSEVNVHNKIRKLYSYVQWSCTNEELLVTLDIFFLIIIDILFCSLFQHLILTSIRWRPNIAQNIHIMR